MASQELNQALWGAANVMRSTMSADEYKDYLLGLVFYKYLSDRQLYAVVDLLEDRKPESLDEAQQIYEEARNGGEWEDLAAELEESYGFAIKPEYTFTALYKAINDRTFTTDQLRQAMRDIEQGGQIVRGQKPYEDLFEEFEEASSPEARFARAMDNFQPLILNHSNGGGDWKEHGISADKVYIRQSRTREGSEAIYEVTDQIIKENVQKGSLKPAP